MKTPGEKKSHGGPIGSLQNGATDFWTVWSPQDQCFVEHIWLTEEEAQQDAANHNARFDPQRSARAYHIEHSVEHESPQVSETAG
jgi:hypothetical protein